MVDLLVDSDSGTGDLAQLEQEIKAASAARTEQPQKTKQKVETQASEETGEDVPAKYKGKSLRDVIEMHRNLESTYGRMANDLGTQRQMTDVLLGLKRNSDLQQNSENPRKVEIKGDELLANPTEALERFNAPREREQHQRLNQIEQQMAAQAFVSRHPDYESFKNDEEFNTWIRQSPIRLRAAQAAAGGDWSTAGDLLSEYKQAKKAVAATDDSDTETEEHPLKAARAASFESSSQGNSGGKKGAKIYKRADVMRLRISKPDVYYSEEFQNEIVRAYAEDRVK